MTKEFEVLFCKLYCLTLKDSIQIILEGVGEREVYSNLVCTLSQALEVVEVGPVWVSSGLLSLWVESLKPYLQNFGEGGEIFKALSDVIFGLSYGEDR